MPSQILSRKYVDVYWNIEIEVFKETKTCHVLYYWRTYNPRGATFPRHRVYESPGDRIATHVEFYGIFYKIDNPKKLMQYPARL